MPEYQELGYNVPKTRAGEKILSPLKIKTLSTVLTLSVFAMPTAQSSAQVYVQPGGIMLPAQRTNTGAVIAAYQQAYAMRFEVWKPYDLPAGWYATFDGFPVAQVAENRWVYGQFAPEGIIRPTNILVGSVVPSSIPGLVRIASAWSSGRYIQDSEFLKIREYRINRMGWLNDGELNTIIAWRSGRAELYIWLGNRWKRLTPNPGEYTWQMLKRLTPWIIGELRKANALYMGGEPLEVADLARQWGLIWGGRVVIESMNSMGYDGGNDGTSGTTSLRDTSTSTGDNTTTPAPQNNNNNNGQWDVD